MRSCRTHLKTHTLPTELFINVLSLLKKKSWKIIISVSYFTSRCRNWSRRCWAWLTSRKRFAALSNKARRMKRTNSWALESLSDNSGNLTRFTSTKRNKTKSLNCLSRFGTLERYFSVKRLFLSYTIVLNHHRSVLFGIWSGATILAGKSLF